MSNLIVNFGGPRSLGEVEPFLIELLNDRDVIRSGFPAFFHRFFFTRVAKKRAKKIAHDYELIGGKSPIFDDTEAVAGALGGKVLTFHRYLPATHLASLEAIENCADEKIAVFPMFPQFSYATTGSIARFFQERLSVNALAKLFWVKSYAGHEAYIAAMQTTLRDFLKIQGIGEEECLLLFSAHGVPQKFIATGDIYERECRLSYEKIKEAFPKAEHLLAYQSKFGRGAWLEPSTESCCKSLASKRRHVVVVPLSFTSDHIETLFEIEYQYLPLIRERGFHAHRCPALNRQKVWIEAIGKIVQSSEPVKNEELVRYTAHD